ncbi:MAG: cytochrome c maturation protein CcmE [Rubellimicrobium sp.]|nr:cytochrome c maturation protein CcmE [Rubellimicrobium sp.]
MAGLRKKRRIQIIVAAFVALGLATAIIGYAMRDGINFFYMPDQVLADPPPETQVFRLGGNVEEGSIHEGEGVQFTFRVTDGVNAVPVAYVGRDPRPDLFGEGQGTIATGRLVGGVFQATELLAKHDESYVPREVIEGLRDAGVYVAPEGGGEGGGGGD